jgi:hypothetical protein
MVNLPRSMAASQHQVLSRRIFAGCSPTVLRRLQETLDLRGCEGMLIRLVYAAAVRGIIRAMSQMKAASSRAIATTATLRCLPRAVSLR